MGKTIKGGEMHWGVLVALQAIALGAVAINSESTAEAGASQRVRFERTPNHVITGENVETLTGASFSECATACVVADWCASFDYAPNECYLSDKTAEDVGGLAGGFVPTNYYDHFARIDRDPIRAFLPTPGAAIPGNNIETVQTWSADVCANACLANDECRSFEVGGGACYLSDKAPGDADIEVEPSSFFDLYTASSISLEITNSGFTAGSNVIATSELGRDACLSSCEVQEGCVAAEHDALSQSCAMHGALSAWGDIVTQEGSSITSPILRETLSSTFAAAAGRQLTLPGYEFHQIPNRFIGGYNIDTVYGTIESCLLRCQLDDSCLSVDYSPGQKKCYLNSANASTAVTSYTAGDWSYFAKNSPALPQAIQRYPNFSSPGAYTREEENTIDGCSKSCIEDLTCASFDYDRQNGVCHFSGRTPQSNDLAPAVSGRWDHYAVSTRHPFVKAMATNLGFTTWWETIDLSWRHLLPDVALTRAPVLALVSGPIPAISIEIDNKVLLVRNGAAIVSILHSQGVPLDAIGLTEILTEVQIGEIEAEFEASFANGITAKVAAKLAGVGVSANVAGVDVGVSASVGSGSTSLGIDKDGLAMAAAGCAAQADASLGSANSHVESGCANGTFVARSDGFAVGAGLTLVAVKNSAGSPERTHAAAGVGVGIGAAGAARWGQDGQYGFSVDFKFISVGAMVHGEDVEQLLHDVDAGSGLLVDLASASAVATSGIVYDGMLEAVAVGNVQIASVAASTWAALQSAWSFAADAFETVTSWF